MDIKVPLNFSGVCKMLRINFLDKVLLILNLCVEVSSVSELISLYLEKQVLAV